MSTDARIQSLETQVRTLKRMLFGVFGVVVVGGLLAATTLQSVPDVIQAKKFEVVNSNGVVVSTLGSDADGGLLQMTDEHGGLSHVLTVLPSGEGQIATKNGKGQTLVRLGVTEGGNGSVTTENGKGGTLVRLGAGAGGGSVTTQNGKGQILVELGVTEGGNGLVITENGKGQTLVELGATVKGEGMVTTENGKGQTLVALGVAGGNGLVVTQNGKGGTLVRLGTYTGLNGGYVETFTQTGVSSSEIP